MQILKLDHVNIRTAQLATMMTWYVKVLGLRSGARPNFPFGGAWMYAGETVVVHLVEIGGSSAVGSEASLKMEHFAFTATDAAGFEARLSATNTQFRKVVIEEIKTIAFNVWDPDGNHIHVDFPTDE